LLIQRLTASFELFEKQFANDKERLEQLKTNLTGILQNYEDLVGGVEGLLRLQKIYKLKSSDFSQGIVDGQKTRNAMKAFDLFIIGREASKIEFENWLAIEYLELTVEKFKSQGNKDDDLNIVEACNLLAEVQIRTSNFKGALDAIKFILSLDVSNEKAKKLELQLSENFAKYGNSLIGVYNPFNDTIVKNGIYKTLKESYMFGKACRGELKNTPKVQAKLKCRYHSASFFSLIAPFKMEDASLSPVKVSLFYDMITDREIEQLKLLSASRLKVGTIVDKAGVDIVVKNRITKTAFVFDHEHVAIDTISKRVEVKKLLNIFQ
jgi:Prolyl 4-Hydroxylase alpha-subunit, N-terminal region